jgi:hypothetical protein
MMRFRIGLVAAGACLSLGLLAGTASAKTTAPTVVPNVTTIPALYTEKVASVAKAGKQFKGTYAIQRFVDKGGQAEAVGILKGTYAGHHITKYNFKTPASLTSGSSSGTSGSARDAAAASCTVLNLVLGPINLNLLGLVVQVGGLAPGATTPTLPIQVLITAVPADGLLGNLLCDLTNALNQNGVLSGLQGDVTELVGALNGLTTILGELPTT